MREDVGGDVRDDVGERGDDAAKDALVIEVGDKDNVQDCHGVGESKRASVRACVTVVVTPR